MLCTRFKYFTHFDYMMYRQILFVYILFEYKCNDFNRIKQHYFRIEIIDSADRMKSEQIKIFLVQNPDPNPHTLFTLLHPIN